MARPEDHYLAVFEQGTQSPQLMSFCPKGWMVVEDPESPPPGMQLAEAIEAAGVVREHLDAEGSSKAVLIMQRQSTGAYFPVAHVDTKALMLLFDPGAPRLQLTREGRARLKQLDIRLGV